MGSVVGAGVWGLHEKRAGCCFPWYTWRYNEKHWTGDAAVFIVCMIRPRPRQTPVWFYSMISYQRSIASRRGSAPLRRTIVKHFHFHCYSSSEACTNKRIIYTPRLNIKPSEIIIISIVGIVYFTLFYYSIVCYCVRLLTYFCSIAYGFNG